MSMPHINRIRVNNVKYNFGTQFYDDFMMKPYGKNMLYDLANGGGKSVLMLLLLQNVIPNCTLDEKQPIEKLFRTGNGSSTIHSLIEWQLNENHVKNGFIYMTTGFCARKAAGTEGEEEGKIKDTAAIEYFNYCIFYREYNDNDIRNLPLINGKERITYNGLRKYLKELERDNGLIVKIYDRKGEYQRFIRGYGIYESEWEIIRGINKTEGHVRTYFETNYKTTRKVVENLLIEEIIQKSFLARTNQTEEDDMMADTLLNIKDKLLELSKRKNEIRNYDRQVEVLEAFAERIKSVSSLYQEKDQLEEMLVKSYNTGAYLSKRKEAEYQKLLEEIVKLEKNLRDLGQCIEIIKLRKEQYASRELKREVEKQEIILVELEERLSETKEILAKKESINIYLEFLDEKKNRDEVVEAVHNMKNRNMDLLTELNILAYNRRIRDEKRLLSLHTVEGDSRKKLNSINEQIQTILFQQRELEKQVAMDEAIILRNNETIDKINKKVGKLRKNVNLLFMENIHNAILESQKMEETGENYIEKVEGIYYRYNEEQGKIRLKITNIKHKADLLEEKIEEIKEFIQTYQVQKKKADELREIYGSSNYEDLYEIINYAIRKNAAKISRKQEGIEELKAYEKQLEKGVPLEISKELLKVKDYLDQKYKGSAMLGITYMEELPGDEKRDLLQRIPLLPYAILMKDNYDHLAVDKAFMKKDFGMHPVPILRMDALQATRKLISQKQILFAVVEEDLFLFPEKLTEKKEEIALQIEVEQKELERLKEQQEVSQQHCVFATGFVGRYYPIFKEKTEEYERLKKEQGILEEEKKRLYDKLHKLTEKAEADREKIRAAKQRKKEIQKETLDLLELRRLFDEIKDLEEEKESIKEHIDTLMEKNQKITQQINKKQWEADNVQGKLNGILHMIKTIEIDWEEKYSAYYVEQNFYELDLSDEEIETAFGGKKLAFETENSDLEDKERLIKSYENGMKRCLRTIEEKGSSIEQLEVLRQSNLLTPVEVEEQDQLKDKMKEQEEKIRAHRIVYDASKQNKYQLVGKIQEKEDSLHEKYGKLITLHVKESECDTFIEENTKAYKLLEKGYLQKQKKAKNYQEDMKFYEDMEKDIAHILRTMEISKGRTAERLDHDINIKSYFTKTVDAYERLIKDVRKQKAEFEKQKMKSVETLRLLEAFDLADELIGSIQPPETYQGARQIVESLLETNRCIMLEKERMERGTEDLLKIKDNFENQCLQRCSNIKTELERLSKLSKINLDGELISIIHLNIPYIKEEFEKQQMSIYIDEVVKGVDQFTSSTEKVKFIRNALSWKKLFSVIVTDMNQIKLNLYKRERMKEQSRHLRYEEAVGSTGQSQGIYIQFLIAIINYITNLNSIGGEMEGLRKVIFIDNPFGAAKDVYIWEPIFEMLRTNQVQLIVPARGTTPAMTGRFDVNYVLGQKLVDGKQQTVVIDYQSDVNTNEIEYAPLNFEQTSMF